MASITDITVNIASGQVSVNRVGFGIPALVGLTGQRSVLTIGSGSSQLIAKSTSRQNTVSLVITIATGYTYAFAAGVVTIELPAAASTVRDLVADFVANAPTIVTDELTLQLPNGQTGSGTVAALVETALTFTEFRELQTIEQLAYYYDTTDTEYEVINNMLLSVPTPRRVYLIDEYNGGAADITQALTDNDTGVWYCILTTSTTEADQQEISDYAAANKKLCILLTDTITRLDTIQDKRTAYIVHNTADLGDHPEASWAAKNLPQDPGSLTWKYTVNLQGQVVSEFSLSDLLLIRTKKAQSYVSQNGLSLTDEGKTTDPDNVTYIDQIRSRDFVESNLAADLLELFANEPKIPYTNQGIAQIVQVVTNRLSLAGRQGIIAPVENSDQAALSTDGVYRFNVTAPTRESIETDSPADIVSRILNNVNFSYIEAGAIHETTVTGVVILSE